MRRIFGITAAIAALAWSALYAGSAAAQGSAARPSNPQIDIEYVPPKKEDYRPIYGTLTKRKVLETLQQFLAPVKLSRRLSVKIDECDGAMTAPYKYDGLVKICYEYVAEIERLSPRSTVVLTQGDVTVPSAKQGPFVQAVLHSVALALFDLLNVPVWGRNEDAADRVSAFILLNFGSDVALNTIIGTAWFLSANTTAPPDFADERGIMAQRYYTMLCLAYGRDRQTFGRFVAGNRPGGEAAAGDLPAARAVNCRTEYNTLSEAFAATILPHLDKALLKRVQQEQWLDLTR